MNSGGWQGRRRSRRKKKGRRADLWWLLSLAEMLEATDSGTGDGAGGSRWSAVALFFPFLSLLCFSFFSLLLLLLFSALSLLFSSFRSSPLSFFFAPPIFIGKNRGGMWLGRPLCCRPKNCPRNTSPPSSPTRGKLRASGGGVSVFLKREMAVTEEEKKSSSSPASHVQGKKKTHSAFKTTPFWVFPFFFNEQCMKRLRFGQNVSFYLNENAPNLC